MVNHPALQRDLFELEKMVANLDKLLKQLEDKTLPHHELQITSAAVVSLKELIAVKTRDIKRRLKGS